MNAATVTTLQLAPVHTVDSIFNRLAELDIESELSMRELVKDARETEIKTILEAALTNERTAFNTKDVKFKELRQKWHDDNARKYVKKYEKKVPSEYNPNFLVLDKKSWAALSKETRDALSETRGKLRDNVFMTFKRFSEAVVSFNEKVKVPETYEQILGRTMKTLENVYNKLESEKPILLAVQFGIASVILETGLSEEQCVKLAKLLDSFQK
jgi:hypothetical protein